MSHTTDHGTRLARAIAAHASKSGCPVIVANAEWRYWSSATFAGARHGMTLLAPCSAPLEKWMKALAEAEFDIPRTLVADLSISGIKRESGTITVQIEALTVDI
ncbi:MAG: hypothetical protein ABIS14_14700 [Sphingomonas sp.]